MKSYHKIEKQAINFRNAHGISSSSSLNLKSLLLKLGVTSFFKPLSSDFSGMAIKSGTDRFMLINTSQNLGRQNFTICHELYHLFIQEDFTSETTLKVGQFNKLDINEMHADLFASYLLMPQEGIYSMISNKEIDSRNISLDTVVKLEQYFQVSRMAMLYRLKNLNLLDSNTLDEYSRGIIKSAARRGYSDELYTKSNHSEFIGSYGDLANHLVETEKISEGDYYSLMMDIGIDVLATKIDNDSNA